MRSKTKIIVLHMKEIIYTVIFLFLAIFIVLLLYFMFFKSNSSGLNAERYTPGTYTSEFMLNNTKIEVAVTVDDTQIKKIELANLDENIPVMYPLIQPAIDQIAEQIYESQSLEQIVLPSDNPYTSQLLINAIEAALKKATVS